MRNRPGLAIQTRPAYTDPILLNRPALAMQTRSGYTVPDWLYRHGLPIQTRSCYTDPAWLYRPGLATQTGPAIQTRPCYTDPALLYRPGLAIQTRPGYTVPALLYRPDLAIPPRVNNFELICWGKKRGDLRKYLRMRSKIVRKLILQISTVWSLWTTVSTFGYIQRGLVTRQGSIDVLLNSHYIMSLFLKPIYLP